MQMHWGKEKLVDEKERKGISYSEGPYMHTVLRSHRYAAAEAGPTRMLTGRSKTPKKEKNRAAYHQFVGVKEREGTDGD
jgi:hypothetical protein